MPSPFHIGITHDILGADGRPWFDDFGLERLDEQPGVTWEVIGESVDELAPRHLQAYDGLFVLAPRVSRASLAEGARTCVVARFGVGYDSIDVAACTEAGIAVTITPDGVRRPVAAAMLTQILALAHRVLERDALVRQDRWADKFGVIGTGLTGRTISLIGLGSIGTDLCRLLAPLDVVVVAHDPYADPQAAAAIGVQLVGLDEAMARGDFVCIAAPLTAETHGLIDAGALARMRPSAYLVNAARGPIVDEAALIAALQASAIAGAALDVFDPEPPRPDNPLLTMGNVLLTPHNIAHTDELYRLTARSAIDSLLAVAAGVVPAHVVNRAVVDDPAFTRKPGWPGRR